MGKRAAKLKLPKITEGEFTTQVIELALAYGWQVKHDLPSRTKKGWRTAYQGCGGFPDIVAVRYGRKVLAELKVGNNKPTEEQLLWLNHWGKDAYLWYPEDWRQIEDVFSGRI